jgi:TetR/AcrR family transcriptional regulator
MPTDTRQLLLDAAERLFAAQGFPRTTIKQIGQAAGVNSALLYYYFGDKDRLYREVLQRLIGIMVERTSGRLAARGTPADRLRGLLEAQAEVLASQPNLPKLLLRELADHDADHAVEQVQLLAATTFRMLCELVREGQRDGSFRDDVDPRFAAVSVISQVAYFHLARPAVRILLQAGAGGPSPDQTRAFTRHAADFALAGLGARPGVAPCRRRSP